MAAGDVAAGSEEVLHYVRDALGSVVGLLDAGEPDATPEPVPARLVERYDYDPYGKTYIAHWDPAAGSGSGDWVRHEPDEPSAFGNPFMWTGQRHDVAIGLYHFPFRTYSPRLGRWLQRDPLGYVDGVNMYEYVVSSPTNFIDALGLYRGKGIVRKTREAIGGVVSVGPSAAYDAGAGDSYDKSVEYSNKYGDKGSADDPGGARNAARHANWQARLTYKYGEEAAEKVGDIHEAGNADDPDTQAGKHNNAVGREIGRKAKEDGRPIEDIDDMVDEAMDDGRLIRDRKNDSRITNPTEEQENPRSDSPSQPGDSSPETNQSDSPSDKPSGLSQRIGVCT